MTKYEASESATKTSRGVEGAGALLVCLTAFSLFEAFPPDHGLPNLLQISGEND